MFKRISLPFAVMTLGATYAGLANAYDEGQWVTTFTAGANLIPHATLQPGATGDLADLDSIDPALAGTSADVSLKRLSVGNAFRAGPALGIEMGYLTQSRIEPFVRLDYSQLLGRKTQIGEMTSAALASPAAVRGDFDDSNSWALNVGARYFLADAGQVRPFVAGFVGVDRSDELATHLMVDGVEGELGKQILLPRETRFDAGVETGVNYQLSDRATLQFSVGADYAAPRHEESTAFESLGMGPIRIAEQRWSIPVDLGVNFQF